jgi:hypothetical protein
VEEVFGEVFGSGEVFGDGDQVVLVERDRKLEAAWKKRRKAQAGSTLQAEYVSMSIRGLLMLEVERGRRQCFGGAPSCIYQPGQTALFLLNHYRDE